MLCDTAVSFSAYNYIAAQDYDFQPYEYWSNSEVFLLFPAEFQWLLQLWKHYCVILMLFLNG